MPIIVLSILGCAWLGYFAYCFKGSRNALVQTQNGLDAFSHSLEALSGSKLSVNRSSPLFSRYSTSRYSNLIDAPRTPNEASLRRRYVASGLAVISVMFLCVGVVFGTTVFGSIGWMMHFLTNVALLSYICLAISLKHRSAEHEIRSMLVEHGSGQSDMRFTPAERQMISY